MAGTGMASLFTPAPSKLGGHGHGFAMQPAAASSAVVEDRRQYGPSVVERLRLALVRPHIYWPDFRHKGVFFLVTPQEMFYIAPLPSGKTVLLARWPL